MSAIAKIASTKAATRAVNLAYLTKLRSCRYRQENLASTYSDLFSNACKSYPNTKIAPSLAVVLM
jgi:hypothetical protein